jgi:hypothetical protein
LRFNVRRTYSPGSENELVDVESFSDDVVEIKKKAPADSIADLDAGGASPQASSPKDRASPKFAEDLERTVQRGDGPTDNLPLVETHEKNSPRPRPLSFSCCLQRELWYVFSGRAIKC